MPKKKTTKDKVPKRINEKEKKNKGGRPVEYDPEEVKTLVEEYFKECEDYTENDLVGMSVKGTELYKPRLVVRIPTIEGLALKLDINKTTIYEWEQKYDEFSNHTDRLRKLQAEKLINNGLSGAYNPTIAKVLLTKHGYREGMDHTSDDKPINTTPEKARKSANDILGDE